MTDGLSRRAALRSLAAGAAGTLVSEAAKTDVADKAVAPAAQPPGICVLFPQAVEGPYYFDPGLVRADITEGRPGTPLTIALNLIDYATCAPLANVRVDVWHADAGGVYSGYAGQGDTRDQSTKGEKYLRGTQVSGADGRVEFKSVYPGWYPGRTPHIHVKAFLGETAMLTGQMYFPDDVSARVYRAHAPYQARPVADTTNAQDFLFRQGEKEGGGIVLAVDETDGGMRATLIIAVDRSGEKAKRASTWGSVIRRWFGGRE